MALIERRSVKLKDYPLSPLYVVNEPGSRRRIAVHFTSGRNGNPLPATRRLTPGEARKFRDELTRVLDNREV